MHKKGKFGLIVAATAVAALIAAGTVSASSHDATGAALDRASTTDMRALLLPKAVHPAGAVIDFEASLAQVGSASLPGTVYTPATCDNFLDAAVPGFAQANGWIRATDRQSPSFDHNNFVLELNAEVSANADRIRSAALSCGNGRVTLDDKVTGSVVYKAVPVTAQPGTTSLGFEVTVKFPAPTNAEQVNILARHGYPTALGRIFITIKKIIIILTTTVLYRIDSPNPQVAAEAATAFAKQVTSTGTIG